MKNEAFIVLALVLFVFFFSWIFSEHYSITGSAVQESSCRAKCYGSYERSVQECQSVNFARACYERAFEQFQACMLICE